MADKVKFEMKYRYEKEAMKCFIVYPIEYKSKKYYVEFTINIYGNQYLNLYEYEEKKFIFTIKYKGERLLRLSDEFIDFDLHGFNEFEEFKLQIPVVLKKIFEIYEEGKIILSEAEKWNGILKTEGKEEE